MIGRAGFGVDHYRPQSLFPELVVQYDNLYYCCNLCNSAKRSVWPSAKDWARGAFIPNPCEHVMFHHLKYTGPTVEAKSTAGKFTRDLLKLNAQKTVEYRRRYQRLIDGQLSLAASERERIRKIDRALAGALASTQRARLQADKARLEARVQILISDAEALAHPVP